MPRGRSRNGGPGRLRDRTRTVVDEPVDEPIAPPPVYQVPPTQPPPEPTGETDVVMQVEENGGAAYTDQPDLWESGGDAGLTYIPSTYDYGGMAMIDDPTVGISDPNPEAIGSPTEPPPVIQVPPSPPTGTLMPPPTEPGEIAGEPIVRGDPNAPALGSLYPVQPETEAAQAAPAVTATEAGVTEAEAATADAYGAGAQQAEAGVVEGGPTEMSAAQQMADITAQDSPLMARARQQGLQTAARRGLLNSTISAQAAMGSMVDKALPLAQQDAATATQLAQSAADRETQVSGLNAQLGTDVSKFNAQQLNEAEKINAQMQTAVSQGNAQAYNAAQQQLADLQTRADLTHADQTFRASTQYANERNQMTMQTQQAISDLNKQFLAGSQAIDLAQIQGQYNNLIAQNEGAARIFDSYLSGMASIMANKDIDPARVAQYVQTQLGQMEGALQFLQDLNNFNLGDFSWGSGGYNPGGTGTGGGGGGTDGGGGGGGGPTCFEAGTCFRMADGSVKKIEDIKSADEMERGGRVFFAISGDGTQETWFDADGIHVTGSHAIKKDGIWMRVRDAGFEQIETIDTFYTLINENHRMVAENGQVFADYDEVDLDGTGWSEYAIDKLNGKTDKPFRGELAA